MDENKQQNDPHIQQGAYMAHPQVVYYSPTGYYQVPVSHPHLNPQMAGHPMAQQMYQQMYEAAPHLSQNYVSPEHVHPSQMVGVQMHLNHMGQMAPTQIQMGQMLPPQVINGQMMYSQIGNPEHMDLGYYQQTSMRYQTENGFDDAGSGSPSLTVSNIANNTEYNRFSTVSTSSAPLVTPSVAPSAAPSVLGVRQSTEQKSEARHNLAIIPDTDHLPLVDKLELYRENAKRSNDPQVQLDFAKWLIDSAVEVTELNPKLAQRQRQALLNEALKWTKRLASQGMGLNRNAYPEAQFFLANCYGNASLGSEVDHERAFQLYLQASKQNHAKATYRAAVCYELGAGTKRDHPRAVQFYRKAATLGDIAAMYKLGVIQLNGLLNQQKNPREAITWLKRAAAQADAENPHALHELGLCYEHNVIPSVIADERYACELFTQAAQLGYAPSQYKMGACYEYGQLGCKVDPRRSIAWYTRAAEQGDPESELALSGWYLTGADGVLKQSDTEAYLWARRAADKGLAKAEYAVGYYSEMGIGVKQDLEEARRWYLRAASQGNKRAMQRLTEMKKGVPAKAARRPTKEDACLLM